MAALEASKESFNSATMLPCLKQKQDGSNKLEVKTVEIHMLFSAWEEEDRGLTYLLRSSEARTHTNHVDFELICI